MTAIYIRAQIVNGSQLDGYPFQWEKSAVRIRESQLMISLVFTSILPYTEMESNSISNQVNGLALVTKYDDLKFTAYFQLMSDRTYAFIFTTTTSRNILWGMPIRLRLNISLDK